MQSFAMPLIVSVEQTTRWEYSTSNFRASNRCCCTADCYQCFVFFLIIAVFCGTLCFIYAWGTWNPAFNCLSSSQRVLCHISSIALVQRKDNKKYLADLNLCCQHSMLSCVGQIVSWNRITWPGIRLIGFFFHGFPHRQRFVGHKRQWQMAETGHHRQCTLSLGH